LVIPIEILDLHGLGDKSEDASAGWLELRADSIFAGSKFPVEHGLSGANFRYCLRDKAAWVAPLAVTVRFPSSRFDEMVRLEWINPKRASRKNLLGEKCESERQW
jgi:hypothetical protein